MPRVRTSERGVPVFGLDAGGRRARRPRGEVWAAPEPRPPREDATSHRAGGGGRAASTRPPLRRSGLQGGVWRDSVMCVPSSIKYIILVCVRGSNNYRMCSVVDSVMLYLAASCRIMSCHEQS